jgi:hypothetical protein
LKVGHIRTGIELLLLAILFATSALSCEADEVIAQKPLQGELATLKLALNQPLQAWRKVLGNGQRADTEDENAIAFAFGAGRFIITVEFTGTSRLGTSVTIGSREGEPELTLQEATQIMSSLGLNNPKKMTQDDFIAIEPTSDSRTWGEPPSADNPQKSSPVYGVFRPKNMDMTGVVRVLYIWTSLNLAG